MTQDSAGVAIVGGGQAGLALSYHLTELGREHVVLERARIAESWRSRRWDSLRLIAPNWSLALPGFSYPGDDPDGFMGKDEVVEHLVGYASSFGAPVREGVRVAGVERDQERGGFVVRTDDGPIAADQVVLATGALQRPNLPPFAAGIPPVVHQLVASDYRGPDALPDGGKVLIVGSGETGCQIAEELAAAGREVLVSWGRCWWAPRRYRGQDIARWLRLTGWFDRLTSDLPSGTRAGMSNPQLTGAGGGHDLSAHTLRRDGVRVVGRLVDARAGTAYFADDVAVNLAWGDDQARSLLDRIDRQIEVERLEAPEPDRPAELNHGARATPDAGPRELDLVKEHVGVVIWATGYGPDFGWVGLPFLDSDGHPIQRRGVTEVDGLYVLGLDWLYTAKSGLFAGLGDDAAHVTSVIGSR